MELYDGISDMELSLWEKLPDVSNVLCSKKMGAWLLRRDENKEQNQSTWRWRHMADRERSGIVSYYRCGYCGESNTEQSKFCPNCGKMMELL